MQAQEKMIKIIVAMDADKQSEAPARVRNFSSSERLMSGLKFLGMCWGIAILSILVPVLHFFLVPGFLLGGIIVFFIRYNRKDFIESMKIVCPNCQRDFEIANLSFNWPLRQACPQCQMILLLKQE